MTTKTKKIKNQNKRNMATLTYKLYSGATYHTVYYEKHEDISICKQVCLLIAFSMGKAGNHMNVYQ